jgi:predicted GNAT family N-acyltransferase
LSETTVETRSPESPEEWECYYALRWRILRAPWQTDGPDRDETDAGSTHRMVCKPDGVVVAVGRLHQVDDTTAQIRFMAVDQAEQRRGYGSLLLGSLEQAAADMLLGTVILQAREDAVPFYEHHGYKVVEKTFLLFNEIQHYLMRKELRS